MKYSSGLNTKPYEMKDVTGKPHKFFERYLDNNLDVLSGALTDRYEKIQRVEVLGVTPLSDNELWKTSNSVSTMKWREYNVFQFHIPQLHNLFKSIREMIKNQKNNEEDELF